MSEEENKSKTTETVHLMRAQELTVYIYFKLRFFLLNLSVNLNFASYVLENQTATNYGASLSERRERILQFSY